MSRLLAVARSPLVRRGFLLLAVAFAIVALVRRRDEVADAVAQVEPVLLGAAFGASALSVWFFALCWRAALADLGSRLPVWAGCRVFLIGQLGKYVPGSIWQVVASVEAGAALGVPRRRTASALVLSLLVTVSSGLALGLAALPLAPGDGGARLPLLIGAAAALPVLLAAVHPAVLNPLLDRALRLTRREPLESRTTLRGSAVGFGLAAAGWAATGVQVYLLCTALGADQSLSTFARSVGGFSLAWVAGLVVVFAPAGVGVREVVLGAVLVGVLPGPRLLLVVLLSRVLLTVADLGLALAATVVGRTDRPDPANGTDPGGRTDPAGPRTA